MMQVDSAHLAANPRSAVVQMIGFMRRGATVAEAAQRSAMFNGLDDGRKAVAWAVANQVAALQPRVAGILDRYVKHTPSGRRAVVGDILICGATELLVGRISPALIVASCVSYTKDLGFGSMAGLVNAVLRRISDEVAMKRAA